VHPFYPFLRRNQHWTKFPKKGTEPGKADVKDRPISYAAKLDAFIFSYYRETLYDHYERELKRLGLSQCVLAYRHIPFQTGKGGKCNVHFADHAFRIIRSLGSCTTFALDIRQFFENLDHERIKQVWWQLLGSRAPKRKSQLLPDDHYNVYKAVTQYSFIDRDMAYKKLGHLAEVPSASGRKQWRFTLPRNDFPPQICGPRQFRAELKGLIRHNSNPFGIPQGSPISDLLANAYMIDFDREMNQLISQAGGSYFRYSDDILIILPDRAENWAETLAATEDVLKRTAPRLELKGTKTQVHRYKPIGGGPDQEQRLVSSSKGPDGMEYLGFRYDGKKVYLRNTTIAGFQRKITAVAERMAWNHVVHHPELSLEQLVSSFNYNVLIRRFGRVNGFDFPGREYTTWTFWTYIKKSSRVLGPLGAPLVRQINSYKEFARKRARSAIETAFNHSHSK
jgi:hypothetical protein